MGCQIDLQIRISYDSFWMKVLRIYSSSSSIEVKRMYDGSFKKFLGAYLIACVNFFFYSHIDSLIKYLLRLHYTAVPERYAGKGTERKERGNEQTNKQKPQQDIFLGALRNYIKVNFACFY